MQERNATPPDSVLIIIPIFIVACSNYVDNLLKTFTYLKGNLRVMKL